MSKNNDILSKEIQKIYGESISENNIKDVPDPINVTNKDSDINDILEHLQQNEEKQKPQDKFELKDENLDQFILNNAGQIIKDSVEYIRELREHYQLNSTPDEIKAFSVAVEASAAAIESLNKMSITRQKIKAAKELKEMDTKLKLEQKDNNQITFTRDQLFEMIIKNNNSKNNEIMDKPIDI